MIETIDIEHNLLDVFSIYGQNRAHIVQCQSNRAITYVQKDVCQASENKTHKERQPHADHDVNRTKTGRPRFDDEFKNKPTGK